jgi:LysM repeat protein
MDNAMRYPAVNRITIKSVDGRHSVTGLIGETEPAPTGGRGGWQEVARVRRPAVTEWVGTDAAKATIELLFDAHGTGGTVEAEMAAVDALAPRDPTVETPVVNVVGWWPFILPTTAYVIQSADPSQILRRQDGRVYRVVYSFTLLQYRVADVVVRQSPAKQAAVTTGTSRAKPKVITTRKGDTLAAIAAKYLGSAAKWKTLATLNKIRNPNNLRAGQKIRLS